MMRQHHTAQAELLPNRRYLSPLRYPGGKARLANFIKLVIRENELTDGHYIEPYGGGASVGLALLMGEYVSHIHVNDIDRSVYAFWHSVVNEPAEFCRRIMSTRVSVAEWRRQRDVQRARYSSLLDLGFSAFFLNRTNRSGIIRSGGMIGGMEQAGEWRLNARFPKRALVARIQLIAGYRDRISLYRRDTLALLKALVPNTPKRTLMYLDPPYYVKGGRRLYSNAYNHADHVDIKACLAKTNRHWVVSYDDVKETRELYRGWRCRRYSLPYAACERSIGAEVMFFSENLRIPSMKPTAVSHDS